ncbi:MAG: hypothetical protein KC505_11410, partial [Myxococcales bacterium]|nr:hypothetical protein [Myxococcales bacterium]
MKTFSVFIVCVLYINAGFTQPSINSIAFLNGNNSGGSSVAVAPACDGSAPSYDQTGAISGGPASQSFGDFPTFSNEAADDFITPITGTGTVTICG